MNWQYANAEKTVVVRTNDNGSMESCLVSALPEGAAPDPYPGLSATQIISANTSTRDSLLTSAAFAIAPLQDALDLDTSTAAESALLTKWKQYRVAVSRVDCTAQSPTWPSVPTS